MSQKIKFKTVKIKPENREVVGGVIVSCEGAGSNILGIGPASRVKLCYELSVKAEGVTEPLILTVTENQGWHWGHVRDIDEIVHDASALPLAVGDTVTVEYDRKKPKKCNLVESK